VANIAIPKKFSQTALTSTLNTLLFTVPANTQEVVKEIILCNTDTAQRAVTIFMGTGSAIVDTILDAVPINPGETQFYTLSTVLEAAEIISGGDDAGGVVSCTISGVEVS